MVISSLVPTIILGTMSTIAVFKISQTRIDKGIQNNVTLIRKSLENALESLEYASRQFSPSGNIGNKLDEYFEQADGFQRYVVNKNVREYVSMMNFSNKNLGIVFYYLPDEEQFLFENSHINAALNPLEFPVLSESNGGVYSAPHHTMYSTGGNIVFSFTKRITGKHYDSNIYVYLETAFDMFRDLLSDEQYGLPVNHLLLNDQNEIVYSDNWEEFPVGGVLPFTDTEEIVKDNNQLMFYNQSQQGWSIVASVNADSYYREIYAWFAGYLLVGVVSVGVSILLGWFIWKNIYAPLRILGSEVQRLSLNPLDSNLRSTKIKEFDHILQLIGKFKYRIKELIDEVEENEKMKRRLEVEKLLSQINPHFLHNTLHNIQIMARIKDHDEIDQYVAQFARVLHHNLGKAGSIVSLKEELEVLDDYVSLQLVRYDYQFEVERNVEADLLELQVPRFLLQPLVENALIHGMTDRPLLITLNVKRDGKNHYQIEVTDDGKGMDKTKLHTNTGGMGIGLEFIDKMIRHYYGDNYGLRIQSVQDEGTNIILRLPLNIQYTKWGVLE